MFKNLYIIGKNGILLYSKDFAEEKFDVNLLIGFFTSIANFSSEALGTIVKTIDLGENNKLILVPIPDEEILGAVIVNSNDNDGLVNKIMRNILQDFINKYAPDYKPERIRLEEMEKIINSNLKGKVIQSTIKQLLLSWLIVAPLSYLLVLLSINATTFIYVGLDLNRLLTPDQLFTRFMPALILLSTINIIILFLLPNLIIGYLLLYRRISVINSFIFLVMTIALYLYSFEPNFAYIIIGQLPLTFFFSLFFLFMGMRYSSKRFLKR